jgi:hypothetical protein
LEEKSVFQGGFVLSLLDIVLVTLYFPLVHQVEIKGVAAFPPNVAPFLSAASRMPEAVIISVVFAIYVIWDSANLILRGLRKQTDVLTGQIGSRLSTARSVS